MADFDEHPDARDGPRARRGPTAELRDISTVTFARPDVARAHGPRCRRRQRVRRAGRADHGRAPRARRGRPSSFASTGARATATRTAGRCRARAPALHRFLDRELAHDGDRFVAARRGPARLRHDVGHRVASVSRLHPRRDAGVRARDARDDARPRAARRASALARRRARLARRVAAGGAPRLLPAGAATAPRSCCCTATSTSVGAAGARPRCSPSGATR